MPTIDVSVGQACLPSDCHFTKAMSVRFVCAGQCLRTQSADADRGSGDMQAQADVARPARPRVIIDTTHLDQPFSDAERAEIDGLNLFSMNPQERGPRGVQLAGDPPGMGDNGGPPLNEPPEIPKIEPATDCTGRLMLSKTN